MDLFPTAGVLNCSVQAMTINECYLILYIYYIYIGIVITYVKRYWLKVDFLL